MHMDQQEIQRLIQQSLYEDPQAFGQLVVEYQSFVFGLALKLTCHSDEAEDITQEVFIRAWTHLPQFNPQVKFSTWLYKITANLCFDWLRKHHNHPEMIPAEKEGNVVEYIPTEENITNQLINQELVEKITQLTQELTPKQKLIFTLWDLEGMEPEEIKIITGMSSVKIKSNLYLARKYIRQRISKL